MNNKKTKTYNGMKPFRNFNSQNKPIMAKRLVRGEKKLFGVCSGVANYFDIDPTLMRILFLVAFLFFGTGLLLYFILYIVMPEN